jgi:hypothetical protein
VNWFDPNDDTIPAGSCRVFSVTVTHVEAVAVPASVPDVCSLVNTAIFRVAVPPSETAVPSIVIVAASAVPNPPDPFDVRICPEVPFVAVA